MKLTQLSNIIYPEGFESRSKKACFTRVMMFDNIKKTK
jgi:hypothetical protein